jgi:hypothetical protein
VDGQAGKNPSRRATTVFDLGVSAHGRAFRYNSRKVGTVSRLIRSTSIVHTTTEPDTGDRRWGASRVELISVGRSSALDANRRELEQALGWRIVSCEVVLKVDIDGTAPALQDAPEAVTGRHSVPNIPLHVPGLGQASLLMRVNASRRHSEETRPLLAPCETRTHTAVDVQDGVVRILVRHTEHYRIRHFFGCGKSLQRNLGLQPFCILRCKILQHGCSDIARTHNVRSKGRNLGDMLCWDVWRARSDEPPVQMPAFAGQRPNECLESGFAGCIDRGAVAALSGEEGGYGHEDSRICWWQGLKSGFEWTDEFLAQVLWLEPFSSFTIVEGLEIGPQENPRYGHACCEIRPQYRLHVGLGDVEHAFRLRNAGARDHRVAFSTDKDFRDIFLDLLEVCDIEMIQNCYGSIRTGNRRQPEERGLDLSPLLAGENRNV